MLLPTMVESGLDLRLDRGGTEKKLVHDRTPMPHNRQAWPIVTRRVRGDPAPEAATQAEGTLSRGIYEWQQAQGESKTEPGFDKPGHLC